MKPLRRVLLLISALCLVLLGLSACGDDSGEATDEGSVTVSGEFGSLPKVDYDGRVTRTETKVDVVSEGNGETVGEGDSVMAHYYLGNGYLGEEAANTWAPAQAGQPATPQVLSLGEDTIPALEKALVDHKVGSRVVVEAKPDDAYGEQGNPNLYIDSGDSVVFVVDIMAKLEPEIENKPDQAAGRPLLKFAKGKPSGFDFSKAPSQAPMLRKVVLQQGQGAPVKKGDDLAMRYLGSVWGTKDTFDENYSKEISPFRIGTGQLIKAWDQLLVGEKAGSRVMLIVPSEFGYGEKGQGKKIKPGDDLVFVVDVLGSSPPAKPAPVEKPTEQPSEQTTPSQK